jgi:uncharacterized FlaG/YvyC family protein
MKTRIRGFSVSKKHQVQHKDRREEAKGKELADIKRENQQLKRQVARLNKQIIKVLDAQGELDINDPLTEVVVKRLECDACEGKNLKSVKMPTGLLIVCLDCGKRKKE